LHPQLRVVGQNLEEIAGFVTILRAFLNAFQLLNQSDRKHLLSFLSGVGWRKEATTLPLVKRLFTCIAAGLYPLTVSHPCRM
jgi:hypothetical protein